MQPKLQRVKVEPVVADDHDLSVEHAAIGQLRRQRVGELGEVAGERLLVATLNEELIAVAKDERAEAVPFRLEDPSVARRELANELGEHRKDWRIEGQFHAADLAADLASCCAIHIRCVVSSSSVEKIVTHLTARVRAQPYMLPLQWHFSTGVGRWHSGRNKPPPKRTRRR